MSQPTVLDAINAALDGIEDIFTLTEVEFKYHRIPQMLGVSKDPATQIALREYHDSRGSRSPKSAPPA